MRSAATARPSIGRPRAYERDDILDCALRLLDKDGADAVTFRGVARELGTVPGTLNNYFANLAELEDAVAARLLDQMPLLDPEHPGSLREQLVELGLVLIRLHSTHPYLRHITGTVSMDLGAHRLSQNRKALQAMGLSERDAAICLDVVQSTAHSHGTEIHRVRTGGAKLLRAYEGLWKRLSSNAPPRLTAAYFTPEAMAPAHRTLLGDVVDTLLAGFKARPQVRRSKP